MDLKDGLHRFIFDKHPIRGEFITLTQSFQAIVNQHRYPAPIKKLLGEALAVAGLLSAVTKLEGRLTVQFRGKGALKLLLAQCDHHYQLRGLAKFDPEITYPELLAAFHEGILVIILDSGAKGHYEGIVSWQGHSLAESIEGYFRDSEQLPTKLWLHVSETEVRGLLLQIIPENKEATIQMDEQHLKQSWETIVMQTHQRAESLSDINLESLLHRFYPSEDIRVFPPVEMVFHCPCSRKRGENAIMLLGKEEALQEVNSKQNITVTCEFCNQDYVFNRTDIDTIFENPSEKNLH